MRVRIYWNSRIKKFSVQYKHRTIGHAEEVLLSNCTFDVNERGQDKVRATKQKNVHAFISGDLQKVTGFTNRNNSQYILLNSEIPASDRPINRVYYDPYKTDFFTDPDIDGWVSAAGCVYANCRAGVFYGD